MGLAILNDRSKKNIYLNSLIELENIKAKATEEDKKEEEVRVNSLIDLF